MKAPVPRLELKGVTKRFPGVLANDDVSLKVGPGEIHALLGENGAGKSTLVKIIYGVLKADAGEMFWNGTPAAVASPRAARQLGIGMVFQHFSLFEAMTVMENIALGLDEAVPRRRLERRIRDILETYHLPLDPHRHVHTLSVGERQRIEIVRSLLGSPKLLIMDEPTSVLTPQEVERLFETLRRLAAEGCSILYISHKLQEIKELCSRATILRGGRNVGECVPAKVSTREMAEKMIGGELRDVTGREGAASGKTSFSVSGLNVPAPSAFATSLKEISFSVAAGEILGIAGVAGNGQNELLAALDGETTDVGGTAVRIGETPAGRLDAGERRKLGLCAVPEERNGHGAVSDFPLWENVVLTGRQRLPLVTAGIVQADEARNYAERVIERFAVKASGAGQIAGSLSGGNLQKFIMGREILQEPRILVVSQPTWGVDAGAAAAIHQALVDLAAGGTAIVLISQDLDELLALADRIAVMNEGRLSEPMPVAGVSVERIGLLMGGVHGETRQPAGAA